MIPVEVTIKSDGRKILRVAVFYPDQLPQLELERVLFENKEEFIVPLAPGQMISIEYAEL